MRVSEKVRSMFNPDGAVLMDIEGGQMFNLNVVGSIIWRRLSEGDSPEQIARNLASEFNIPYEQAFTDVNELLQQLVAQHLVLTSLPENDQRQSAPKAGGFVSNFFKRWNSRPARNP